MKLKILFFVLLAIGIPQHLYCMDDNYRTAAAIGIDENPEGVDDQLFRAVSNKKYYDVSSLLSEGANPLGIISQQGHTTLAAAAIRNCIDIAQMLIEHSTKFCDDPKTFIDQADEEGTTPLMYAAYGGHNSFVKLLLQHKASIDQKNAFGATALEVALRSDAYWPRKKDVIYLLLLNGASMPLAKLNILEMVETADQEIQEDMIDFLLKNYHLLMDRSDHHKLDASFKNTVQELLCFAAGNGSIALIKKLMFCFGGDDTIAQPHGITPLEAAIAKKQKHAVDYFIKNCSIDHETAALCTSIAETWYTLDPAAALDIEDGF